MRYDDRLIDELKARVTLSDLIGKSVSLKRQGNEMAGLSPFSKEKTPSFYVVDSKQMYFCHSTGKSGDALTWLMESERLSFPEAVRRLAEITGTALPEPEIGDTHGADREAIFGVLSAAEGWFTQQLLVDSDEARQWLAYLENRGVTAEDVDRFGIGFAPVDGKSFTAAMTERGYSTETLVASGLLCQMPGGGSPYSRFRGRVTFPIRDARGRTVSFGGRIADAGAKKQKYLNGPDTMVFSKNRQWFGLPEALKSLVATKGAGDVLVVEGYLDVIASHRAGIPAVAGMGTSLSLEKLEVLWKRGVGLRFCFDADTAGVRAARRTIDLMLPGLRPESCPRFVLLSEAKDPDELVQKFGGDALKSAIEAAVPLVEMLFLSETSGQVFETPDRRVLLKRRLLAAVDKITDRELSTAFRDDIEHRLEVFFEARASASSNGHSDQNPVSRPSSSHDDQVVRTASEPPEAPSSVTDAAAPVGGQAILGLPKLSSSLLVAGLRNPAWMLAKATVIKSGTFGTSRFQQLAEDLSMYLDQVPVDPVWSELPSLADYLLELGHKGLLAGAELAAADISTPYYGAGLRKEYAMRAWAETLEAVSRVYELDQQYDFSDPELANELGTDAFQRLKTERAGLAASIKSGFLWRQVEFEYQEALEGHRGEAL